MTRATTLLLLSSLVIVVLCEDAPKQAAAPVLALPTLPPFSLPSLPTLPSAIKMPTFEEVQASMYNGMKDAQTNFENMMNGNKNNLEQFSKIAQEQMGKIIPTPAGGLPTLPGVPTPAPLDLSKFTLGPLPTLPFTLPSLPTLPPFKLPFREGEEAAKTAAAAAAAAVPEVKKESLQEVGKFYYENLTPQHALDVLTAKKPLRMPSEFAAPTLDVTKLPKVDLPKLELPNLPTLPSFPLVPPSEEKKAVVNSSTVTESTQRRTKSSSSIRYYRFQEKSEIPESAAAAASGSLQQPAANIDTEIEIVYNPK